MELYKCFLLTDATEGCHGDGSVAITALLGEASDVLHTNHHNLNHTWRFSLSGKECSRLW